MEAHFRECGRCRAVLDSTRNVVELFGDERMVEVLLGFSHRLRRRLEENLQPSRRGRRGGRGSKSQAASSSADLLFSAVRNRDQTTPKPEAVSRPK